MTTRIFASTIAIVCLPIAAGAQSLVDLAHVEQARRAQITRPGRVYTNTDVARFRFPDALSPTVAETRTVPTETAPPPKGEPAATEETASHSADTFDDRDAKYWQARRDSVAMRASRSNQDIAVLLTRLTAPGLPSSERALIRQALNVAQSDLSDLQAEKTALENDARRTPGGKTPR